ncbi:hypothetical protein BC831DRAFT_472317 [Entophlyctis helioformis]|nr:hypothetical protein BC831DRAFT_472317 [Entophlyctis helioformis]
MEGCVLSTLVDTPSQSIVCGGRFNNLTVVDMRRFTSRQVVFTGTHAHSLACSRSSASASSSTAPPTVSTFLSAGGHRSYGILDEWQLGPDGNITKTRRSYVPEHRQFISAMDGGTGVDRLVTCGWDGRVNLYNRTRLRVARCLVSDPSLSFTALCVSRDRMFVGHTAGMLGFAVGKLFRHGDPPVMDDLASVFHDHSLGSDDDTVDEGSEGRSASFRSAVLPRSGLLSEYNIFSRMSGPPLGPDQ